MSNLPVDFEEKVKDAPSSSGGYPYQISASHLMQNFVYACGEFKEEEFDVTESAGENSEHKTRKISLKQPLTGTGQGQLPAWDENANDGAGGWSMVTPTEHGQLLYYNQSLNTNGGWQKFTPEKSKGEFFYWDPTENNNNGKWVSHIPAVDCLIYFSGDDEKWQNIVPVDNSLIYFKDKVWSLLTAPAEGTHVLGAVDGALTWIATEKC